MSFNFGNTDRYTIDTLLKLCLNEETAKDSFKLLYKLANKDNILQNEAKQAFIDLYQVHLAETCIDLEGRLTILDELEVENDMSAVMISAYERALKSNGFTGRIHSGELKSRKKLSNPSQEQLDHYYSKVIEKLKSLALTGDEPFFQLAINSLVYRAPEQLTSGAFDSMLEAIKEITEKQGGLSDGIRQSLTELNSERYDLDPERLLKINAILEKYKPRNIEEELNAFIVKAPWINERDGQGGYINVSAEKAKELAQSYIDKETLWQINIKLLLKGDQRQTFPFAETIGGSNIEKQQLINFIFDNYQGIPVEEQNSVFVNGLIYGAKNDEFTRYAINKLISSEKTEVHGIRLVRYLNPITYEDLLKIKDLITATPDYLRNLEYLDLIELSDEEIINLVEWIKEINYSFALEILYEIIRKNKERWTGLKVIINKLLYVEDIMEYSSFINSSLHIEVLINKSIKDDPSEEHIHFLVDQIIKNYNNFNFGNETLLDHLTYSLVNDYWEQSWPIFGDYFATGFDANYKLRMALERIIFNNKLLFNWANVNPKLYPPVAIKFMNIYRKNDDGSLEWNEYARQLVDKFGDQQKVLDNIRSKFTGYSNINSASAGGLYKKRKVLVDELLDHKFENVREFSKNMSDYLSSRI